MPLRSAAETVPLISPHRRQSQEQRKGLQTLYHHHNRFQTDTPGVAHGIATEINDSSDDDDPSVVEGPRRRFGLRGDAFDKDVTKCGPSLDKIDRRSLATRLYSKIAALVCFCCYGSTRRAATSGSFDYDNPFIRNDEHLYYEDHFNDFSWECSFGTRPDDGVWINRQDRIGVIMATLVWVLILYSCLTIAALAQTDRLPNRIAMAYCTICAMALACHAKTTFTDPGSIPNAAVPRSQLIQAGVTTHAMCSHCQTYKPPGAHHCRICNRCVSRMDHHCPWMNNCIGAANFKHFILFLCYTWTGSAFALVVFAFNYFLCDSEDCIFPSVLVHLVRLMTFLCIGSLLFTSSMIMNVMYGILTGIGTIDRLKKKPYDEKPLDLEEIFGIQGYWTWPLPIDPLFPDYDQVLGYSIPLRLDREDECTRLIDGARTVTTPANAESKGYERV